ncbi:MAG: hypothetical protein AAF661_07300 [Pseudomonadota bacterium]
MPSHTIDRRGFLPSTASAALFATAMSPAAATRFPVGRAAVTALSDGYFTMSADMFLGRPQSLHDRLGEPVQIAVNTYAYRVGARTFLFDAGRVIGAIKGPA